MTKKTKLASLLLAFIMLFTACASTLVACGPDEPPCTSHNDADTNGFCDACGAPVELPPAGKVNYTVSVNTQGGMPLAGVTVYTFKGEDDLIGYAKTNDSGIATIKMTPSDDYWFILEDIPAGYKIDESYTFNGRSKSIILTSELVKDESIPSVYAVGDIFHDMTLTLDDGRIVKLSDVLGGGAGQKKAIVLNFWYTTCSWCIEEFPILNSLAEKYEDSVATFAINTYGENMAAVQSFKQNFKFNYSASEDLTLDMAVASPSLFSAFGTGGYPTTVVIDRYGTICLVVAGAITSETQFEKIFTYFGAENYTQKLFENTADFFPKEKPTDVVMPSPDAIGDAIFAPNDDKISDAVTDFRPETDAVDWEYSWPFILDDRGYIKPSNSKHEASFSTLNIDLSLQKGDVLGFDYWLSTEAGSDIFYVLVDGNVIYSVSGDSSLDEDSTDGWKKCYPIVADKTGEYKLTFIYNKDGDTNYGEDTVYIDNLRILESALDIDTPTYLIKDAATDPLVVGYGSYVAIVYNEDDNYYHVCVNHSDEAGHECDKNGPLLLANLMNIALPKQDEENSIYTWAYNGDLVYNKVDLYDAIVQYCSYASNGTLGTMSPVTLELADLLAKTFELKGFSADDGNLEWLQFCKYFMAYGTNEQFADPIKGLATFSAYETVLSEPGSKEFPNHVTYDRVIMPRGLWFAFTPEKSGAYRITSNTKDGEVDGWIFNGNREELYVYDHVERFDFITYDEEVNGVDYHMGYLSNVSMVAYFEAGVTYYIDIAYYDVYQVGTIDFKVEFMGEDYKIFRYLSPGAFTYNLDTNKIIAGGVKVALHTDGYYYVANPDGVTPNLDLPVYVDFTKETTIFGQPIYADKANLKPGQVLRSLLAMGAFDFTKTEVDREGITHLLDYASIALCDFAKLTDAAIEAKFANSGIVDELKALRTEIYEDVAAWDLIGMKSFLNNSSFDLLVDFLKKNKNGAGEGRPALEAILDAYDTALKSYSDAKAAYDKDESADNRLALENATEILEAKEALIDGYIKNTLLADDALIVKFFKENGQANATTYVDNYTISELSAKYLLDDKNNDKYPDNLPVALCDYVEKEVDAALRAAFASDAEYQAFLEVYKIEDLKNRIYHGKVGAVDNTDIINDYIDDIIVSDDYTNGCVRVNAELAAVLQQLMDYYTFANVENSWVKLCYYWESFKPAAND